jgi:hypothetical protein
MVSGWILVLKSSDEWSICATLLSCRVDFDCSSILRFVGISVFGQLATAASCTFRHKSSSKPFADSSSCDKIVDSVVGKGISIAWTLEYPPTLKRLFRPDVESVAGVYCVRALGLWIASGGRVETLCSPHDRAVDTGKFVVLVKMPADEGSCARESSFVLDDETIQNQSANHSRIIATSGWRISHVPDDEGRGDNTLRSLHTRPRICLWSYSLVGGSSKTFSWFRYVKACKGGSSSAEASN